MGSILNKSFLTIKHLLIPMDHLPDPFVELVKFLDLCGHNLKASNITETIFSQISQYLMKGFPGFLQHIVVDDHNTNDNDEIQNGQRNGQVDQKIIFFHGGSSYLQGVRFTILAIKTCTKHAIRLILLVIRHVYKFL